MSLSPSHLLCVVLLLVLKAGAPLVRQVLLVSPGSSSLCLDHPCHNEVPGLPARLLLVLVFSQHHSPPWGSFCFPPPLSSLVPPFFLHPGLGFPPTPLLLSVIVSHSCLHHRRSGICPHPPGHFFRPLSLLPAPPSAASAPAVMQWRAAGMSSLAVLTSLSQCSAPFLCLVPHECFYSCFAECC